MIEQILKDGVNMLINNKNYEIDRNTAKVTELDKMYCETLKNIINEGELIILILF